MGTPRDIPPGWFPDPDDAAQLRYWDGNAWTEQRMAVPPPPAPPPAGPEPPTGEPIIPATEAVPLVHTQETAGPRAHWSNRRWLVVAAVVVLIVGCLGFIAFAGGGKSKDRTFNTTFHTSSTIDERATTTTTEAWDTTPTDEDTTPDTEEDTTPTVTEGPATVEFTAEHLMSMIGRAVTDDEISALKKSCLRSYEFQQDVHCDDTLGFAFSVRGGVVSAVHLFGHDLYGNSPELEVFPGSLPGGVTWDATMSDLVGTLGEPECVDSTIGYNMHYTIDNLDVEYTVESDHEPTSHLYEISVGPMSDRPLSCT